nr:MAG TPA: hypothetical protein [Caudoviricetes sp.]
MRKFAKKMMMLLNDTLICGIMIVWNLDIGHLHRTRGHRSGDLCSFAMYGRKFVR